MLGLDGLERGPDGLAEAAGHHDADEPLRCERGVHRLDRRRDMRADADAREVALERTRDFEHRVHDQHGLLARVRHQVRDRRLDLRERGGIDIDERDLDDLALAIDVRDVGGELQRRGECERELDALALEDVERADQARARR